MASHDALERALRRGGRPSASAKPSTEMAGTKFFTRSISSAKASSMSVALVKARNTQSVVHARTGAMMSSLRTSGSPPE